MCFQGSLLGFRLIQTKSITRQLNGCTNSHRIACTLSILILEVPVCNYGPRVARISPSRPPLKRSSISSYSNIIIHPLGHQMGVMQSLVDTTLIGLAIQFPCVGPNRFRDRQEGKFWISETRKFALSALGNPRKALNRREGQLSENLWLKRNRTTVYLVR